MRDRAKHALPGSAHSEARTTSAWMKNLMDEIEDDWDDGVTWADPQIRTDYEAALGRLILAHNEIDLQVTLLIERCISRLGNSPALVKLASGGLLERLQNLKMLKALPIDLELGALDLDRLVRLNGDRNIVAHGHFEQNPFDGDHVLVDAKQRKHDFPTDRLNRVTDELRHAARHLSAVVAFYDPPE